MKERFTFRDLLAVPFWFIALLFDHAAIKIGGRWTARMFSDQAKAINNLTKHHKEI